MSLVPHLAQFVTALPLTIIVSPEKWRCATFSTILYSVATSMTTSVFQFSASTTFGTFIIFRRNFP
jgi:hypothetical protein